MRVTPLAESSVPGTGFCSETRLGLCPVLPHSPITRCHVVYHKWSPNQTSTSTTPKNAPGYLLESLCQSKKRETRLKHGSATKPFEDDPEHDSAGHLLEDEHYAGLTYLGTLDKIRSELEAGTRDWVATQISTVVVSGALPEVQFNDVFTFLSNTVLGKTQIDCLELDCDGTHAHLWTGTPTDDDLQCNQCGSEAVVAVDTQPSDSAQ